MLSNQEKTGLEQMYTEEMRKTEEALENPQTYEEWLAWKMMTEQDRREKAEEIARKLFGMWDWHGCLQEVNAPKGLARLANNWLKKNASKGQRVMEIKYPYSWESTYIIKSFGGEG
jgi:hypothetical protein